MLWRYQPPPCAESVIDCYALNVDARTVWTYYHTDFPLVRITDDRARAYSPTPVRGTRAVLAYRDEVIFVGDYDDPLRLAHCRLSDGAVEYHGQAVLVDRDDAPLPLYRPVTTCGRRLYLHTDDHIVHKDLADQHERTG